MADNGWAVEPFDKVGPLRFGMARGEVREALGEEGREFRKGFSENLTEAYNSAGVHVYYDKDGAVEFVEAFSPAQPTYQGVELLQPDTSSILDELNKRGLTARDDGEGGLWFDDHGFALFAPGGKTEGVSIFRRGYDTGA